VYYKVTPPSERNELNLSLLSSARESEIGKLALNDLGRPLTDLRAVSAFDREIIRPKSDNILFFRQTNPFCCHYCILWSLVRSEKM